MTRLAVRAPFARSALAALLSLAGCSHVGSSLQLTIPTWVFTYGGTFLGGVVVGFVVCAAVMASAMVPRW